jgi:hypothetical protein
MIYMGRFLEETVKSAVAGGSSSSTTNALIVTERDVRTARMDLLERRGPVQPKIAWPPGPKAMKFVSPMGEWTMYGGSFLSPLEVMPTVNMTTEIPTRADVHIPTRDYSVPPVDKAVVGILKAYGLLSVHKELFVGCMGGHGRTGLFLALMTKLSDELYGQSRGDPIMRVRNEYRPRAVETREQAEYVMKFPYDRVLKVIDWM